MLQNIWYYFLAKCIFVERHGGAASSVVAWGLGFDSRAAHLWFLACLCGVCMPSHSPNKCCQMNLNMQHCPLVIVYGCMYVCMCVL